MPAMTGVPGAALRGTGSPVRAEVSTHASPAITSPSKGIRSPGRTTDFLAHLHMLRGNRLQLSSPLHVSHVGTDIQERLDGAPGAVHRRVLNSLADGIEQHDAYRFRQLVDEHRTDGGDGHEEVFIEDLAAADVAHRRQHHSRPTNQYAVRNTAYSATAAGVA